MSEVLAEAQIFYGLSQSVSELGALLAVGILGCQAREINLGNWKYKKLAPAMCGNARGGKKGQMCGLGEQSLPWSGQQHQDHVFTG